MKCEYCKIVNDDTGGIAYCTCNGDIPDLWKDVREELPKNYEYVLFRVVCWWIYEDNRRERIYHVEGYWDRGKYYNWIGDEFEEQEEVTHWQPLPPPPDGDKTKEG